MSSLDVARRFDSDAGAILDPDRSYRYLLWRSWGSRDHRCVFVGLNPSTADEGRDDPTIRKCVGFAKRWGFGAIDMVNLFAWRSTDPSGLLSAPDAAGYDNDDVLAEVIARAHRVVWAWGRHNARVRRLVHARTAGWSFFPGCEAGTLGRSQDGSPRHPLMLAYATRFDAGDRPVYT